MLIEFSKLQTLAMEWPDFEKEQKEKEKKQRKKKRDEFIVSDDEDERPTKKGLKKRQKGLLYHISWYRIVIDEGQGIRNKRTRAFSRLHALLHGSQLKHTFRHISSCYRLGLTLPMAINRVNFQRETT